MEEGAQAPGICQAVAHSRAGCHLLELVSHRDSSGCATSRSHAEVDMCIRGGQRSPCRMAAAFIHQVSQPDGGDSLHLSLSNTFAATKDALGTRERREGAQPRNSRWIPEGRRLRSDVTVPGQSGMGTAAGLHCAMHAIILYAMRSGCWRGEWLAWQASLELVEPRGPPSASSRLSSASSARGDCSHMGEGITKHSALQPLVDIASPLCAM